MPESGSSVSTIVRILKQSGFVGYKPVGRGHHYHPLVAQNDYHRISLRKLLRSYLDSSFTQLVSFVRKPRRRPARAR